MSHRVEQVLGDVTAAGEGEAKRDQYGAMPGLWSNLYTGLGGSDRDRTAWHVPGALAPLDSDTLSSLWEDDPIAGTVVDAIVDDGMQGGFSVAYHGTEDADMELVTTVQAMADAIKLVDKVRLSAKQARAFGGSGLVMLVNDGRLVASEPIVPDRVTSIDRLIAQDPRRLTVHAWDLDEHEAYYWTPAVTGFERFVSTELHASHVIVFEGLDSSLDSRQRRWGGWWKPVLQHVWEAIRDYRQSWQSAVAMLQDGSQGVLSLPGLANAIVKGGYSMLETTMQRIQMYRYTGRIMPLDGGTRNGDPAEKFEWVERSFAGIADLLSEHKDIVCQASGIPAPRLYGNYSTSGLNDSGAGASKDWYAKVKSWRSTKIDRPATSLVQLLARTADASDPDHWGIDWPGLEVRTDREQADLERAVADTDSVRIEQGMPPEAIARTRYFGVYTTAAPQLTDEERDAFEVQAELEEQPVEEEEASETEQPVEPAEESKYPTTTEGSEKTTTTPEEVAANAVPPSSALNGAQVAALKEIVLSVAAGELPRASGIEIIIAAFPVDRQMAERIMGEVGRSFVQKSTEPESAPPDEEPAPTPPEE
jgi:hypothetical protein